MSQKLYTAEIIVADDTLDLRSRVLRPGQPIELCHYPEDNFDSTFHIGVRDENGKIISNGTFIQQPHEFFKSAVKPYRLRGMASEPFLQGQGLGSTVIQKALLTLKEKKSDLLWFNARVSAEVFYKKLGCTVIGETFDIPLIGPHKVMYKWL